MRKPAFGAALAGLIALSCSALVAAASSSLGSSLPAASTADILGSAGYANSSHGAQVAGVTLSLLNGYTFNIAVRCDTRVGGLRWELGRVAYCMAAIT
jgi:hypothetical protein